MESLGETLTVIELRAKLRKIGLATTASFAPLSSRWRCAEWCWVWYGLDLDADGKMALLEYLCFRV